MATRWSIPELPPQPVEADGARHVEIRNDLILISHDISNLISGDSLQYSYLHKCRHDTAGSCCSHPGGERKSHRASVILNEGNLEPEIAAWEPGEPTRHK